MNHDTPAGWNEQDLALLQEMQDDGPEVPAGPSEFWRVSVVVAGALDESQEFTDRQDVQDFLSSLKAEAETEGFTAEVYVQHHGHAPGRDCQCVQYETDHRPDEIFNPEHGEG